MNQDLPVSRFATGSDESRAASAIGAIKAAGNVSVEYRSAQGERRGFYAHWLRRDGSLGPSICRVEATESAAWLSAAIALAAFQPGALEMTSREFGASSTANVVCTDGRLGLLECRLRLEIRGRAGLYDVFLVERWYLRAQEPRDARQSLQGEGFPTLAEAARFVAKFIADYEGAAAEDHQAEVDAQHERDRADLGEVDL